MPKQALSELKVSVGKPFSAGLVFLNGKYVAPPYKVERYGTAIRINGTQVSGELIPWDEFLKTQSGVKVETVTPEAPAVEEEPEPAVDTDEGSDFDDLFSDTPAPKKKAPKRAASAPSAPAPVTTVTFDGEFVPNEKSRAMLAKLNKIRTDIELTLRNGGYHFFGTRYTPVTGDRGATDLILGALPEAMKASSSFESFSSAVRARHITYLPETVLRDLFKNRIDYVRLQDRAKAIKEERQWESMLKSR